MANYLKAIAITALLSTHVTLSVAQSGSGTTTRYWDCCKPSCAWSSSSITSPVKTCDKSDNTLADANVQSGCAGGTAYMCSDQSPWAISDDLAYGFAAVSASAPNCCACYQLTFTSTVLSGKKMVVQATNTGSDVASTQFDLAIPGGGFGIYDACTSEWGATSAVWGAQYGGPSTNTCSQFPTALQPGCDFRWDWMQGADNPSIDWEVVTCPAELVAKSGCSVTGYNAANASSTPSSSVKAPAAPISTPKSSTSAIPVKESATIVIPVNKPGSTTKPVSQAPTSASSTTRTSTKTSTTRTFTTPSSSSSKTTPLHPHWAPHRKVSYDARKDEEEADDECEA